MIRLRAPWWLYYLAAMYLLSFAITSWVETFGPAGSGLQIAWPSRQVTFVAPQLPMYQAGLQSGDLIERANGRPIRSEADWFVARANFERGRETPLDVRRDGRLLSLHFVITTPNWRQWNNQVALFQTARLVALLLAFWLAFGRSHQSSALLVSLIFATVAVAEGFPPAGWVATLRHLPWVLSMPVVLLSSSWLLIGAAWLPLCARITRGPRPWTRLSLCNPLLLFAPVIVLSAIALVYEPPALAMSSPFAPSKAARMFESALGVMPQLLINIGPLYQSTRQIWLMEIWSVLTVLSYGAGLGLMAMQFGRVVTGQDRRRVLHSILALTMMLTTVALNMVVRNLATLFGDAISGTLAPIGVVLQTTVFLCSAAMLIQIVLGEPADLAVGDDA